MFILWYSFIVIFLKPTTSLSMMENSMDISKLTRDTEQLSQIEHTPIVESSQENETGDKNDLAENVEQHNGNAGHERIEVPNDVFDSNYVPMVESSRDHRLDSDTALSQQDGDSIGLFVSTIEQKPTYQIDVDGKSEFYPTSERGHALPTHEEVYLEKQVADENYLQPLDLEAQLISETHLIHTDDKSDFYKSSENGYASLIPDEAYYHKQRAEVNYFQPLDLETNLVSDTQLFDTEEKSDVYLNSENGAEETYQHKQRAEENNVQLPDSETKLVSETQLIDTEKKSDFYQSSENEHTSFTPEEAYHHKQRVDENDLQILDSETKQVSETQLIDTKEKLDSYQTSENGHTSLKPEEAYLRKQENDFQPSGSEVTQVIESQLIDPEDTFSDHDRTERSFTDINGEILLNPTGHLESNSTNNYKSIEEKGTNDDINERTSLTETREHFTRKLDELKIKEHAEAEDDLNFNEDNHLNQIGERIVLESDSSIESNPTQQAEVEHGLKSIQNVLNENSNIIEDDIKKSVDRDENGNFHQLDSSVTILNQNNKDNSETERFDRVSDLNSHGESELALELLKRANNNSMNNLLSDFELLNGETLPEDNAAVKENYIPSNDNTNGDARSEYLKRLMVRKIDSEHTSGKPPFPSENDKPVERSKHPYSSRDINYQSELDTLIQKNIEQFTAEDSHDLIDSYETSATTDHESADINSKLYPNIQKEDRIGDVDSDLEGILDSTEILNDSAHEKNKGAFEYLENIGFNLQEVLHVIKTDRNVRAFILNSIILYLPVLICDVLLWIVIVKLVRHIRRQIITNQQLELTETTVVQQNDSEDVDRPMSARRTPHQKSKRSEKVDGSEIGDGDGDYEDSSHDFLYINSKRKDWFPPN